MKKIFLIAFMAVFTSSAFAQLMTARMTTVKRSASTVWIDLGPGLYTGDVDDAGAGIDLGIRFTKMFGGGIGWDIFKASAQTGTSKFTEILDVQAKTGVRYVSPVLFGNQSLYANLGAGAGYYTDMDKFGFVWEVGAGINITPRVSLGIAYNSHSFSQEIYDGRRTEDKSFNVGLISLRLGIGL
ncbi:MAG: outer membrane beta-barrel protein [Prevotella sp.]|nr:outer membrane beta-barrel protein [Prevotella sp.]